MDFSRCWHTWLTYGGSGSVYLGCRKGDNLARSRQFGFVYICDGFTAYLLASPVHHHRKRTHSLSPNDAPCFLRGSPYIAQSDMVVFLWSQILDSHCHLISYLCVAFYSGVLVDWSRIQVEESPTLSRIIHPPRKQPRWYPLGRLFVQLLIIGRRHRLQLVYPQGWV